MTGLWIIIGAGLALFGAAEWFARRERRREKMSSGYRQCPRCGGSGSEPFSEYGRCGACKGDGLVAPDQVRRVEMQARDDNHKTYIWIVALVVIGLIILIAEGG